ncbi:hypothetical protein Tco_0836528 [Tanacetum coccineum]
METIHVTFDEMHQSMAPVRISSGPEPIMMTPGQLNSGLAPSPVPVTTYIRPTDKDLEILFQPMFDEYFDQSTNSEPVPTATVVNAPIVSINTYFLQTIAQEAPSTRSFSCHPHQQVNPLRILFLHNTSGDVSLADPTKLLNTRSSQKMDQRSPSLLTTLAILLVLLAKGYHQRGSIDFEESFDPVAWKSAPHQRFICQCCHQNMTSTRWNVKTAFLNGDLQREVFDQSA